MSGNQLWRGIGLKMLLVMLIVSLPAAAQYQTGNIHGRVLDSTGNALPGVTVTLRGVGAPQTFVTDSQGNFRFLNLDPGQYQLEADLAGFGRASRAGGELPWR